MKRKGFKLKWFMFFALFAMPLLSFCQYSDTNALKYAYDAFPLYQSMFSSQYQSYNPTFEFVFDSSNGLDSYDSDLDDGVFTSRRFLNNTCSDFGDVNIFSSGDVSSRNQSYIRTGGVNGFSRTFNGFDDCQGNILNYSYDSIYTVQYNMTTGDAMKLVDIPNLFFDIGDDSYSSASIKSITVPLNISQTNVGTIPASTPLSWDVSFLHESSSFGYFDSSGVQYSFVLKYIDSNNLDVTAYGSCSLDPDFTFYTETDESREMFKGFNYHCTYTPNTSMSYITASLIIYGSGQSYDPSVFLTYNNNGLYFGGSYLVTNNDDTWSGLTANDAPSGTDLASAPGYHQLYGYDYSGCLEGDWFCNLTHLFDFSFINPFAPIFNLFTNNSSCASIPTIAGLIGSSETTVCPWFDSTTRNIATPVLGLAAMMLVFGFAVRWLGGSSGNMFIDDDIKDTGGSYSLRNKFRRRD